MYHSRKNHAGWICQYQKCSCICQEPSRITGKGSKTAAFRFLSKFSRIKIENIKIKAPSNLYHLPLPPRGSLALVTHICNFCQRKGASGKISNSMKFKCQTVEVVRTKSEPRKETLWPSSMSMRPTCGFGTSRARD